MFCSLRRMTGILLGICKSLFQCGNACPEKERFVQRGVVCIECRVHVRYHAPSLFYTLISGSAKLSGGCAESKHGPQSYCFSCRFLAMCSLTL